MPYSLVGVYGRFGWTRGSQLLHGITFWELTVLSKAESVSAGEVRHDAKGRNLHYRHRRVSAAPQIEVAWSYYLHKQSLGSDGGDGGEGSCVGEMKYWLTEIVSTPRQPPRWSWPVANLLELLLDVRKAVVAIGRKKEGIRETKVSRKGKKERTRKEYKREATERRG